ncbi:MAG: phoR 1 [Firmicutes bacterium]|nr:phoR 1 [Bacillota bacterium]
MLQQLRLKLTLINSAIILTLFLILIAGIYTVADIKMTQNAQMSISDVMAAIKSGELTDYPPLPKNVENEPPPPPNNNPLMHFFTLQNAAGSIQRARVPLVPGIFFVKLTPDGSIYFTSCRLPVTKEQLALLTQKALAEKSAQGDVSLGEYSYFFQNEPIDIYGNRTIVFKDHTPETIILRTIVTTFLGVGLLISLLSFGASFLIANRSVVPIQKAWQQQRDFLADASHELRTPLAIIQTNLEVVLDNPNETVASQNKWLANIQEESICMAKLIDSLLFLARADSHQQLLQFLPFSFDQAVSTALSPFEAVAAEKNITLTRSSTDKFDFLGDETRLKQVVTILVDNALRHTPAEGTISVGLAQKSSFAMLTVSDTGEGIEKEHLDKIFDRFYQVDKARANCGTGLGLAIAKWIVESHGGKICVTSKPLAGTTFIVRLPLPRTT